MKKFIFILSAIFSLSAFSCSKKNAAAKSDKITIGFSIDSFIIERWQKDCDIFINTAKSNGAEIVIQNAGNDEKRQIEQIKNLIDMNVNALVIVAKNGDSLTDVLLKASEKNIPVISYDRLILNSPVSLYISVNTKEVSRKISTYLEANVKPKNYVCILGSPDDFNMSLFSEGINSVLPKNKILYSYFTPEWNYDLSYKKMNEILDNRIIPEAIICGNDAIAEKVINSLREHQLGNIPVFGQDSDIAACRRIASGSQYGTVYKPIDSLARTAAIHAVNLAKASNPKQYLSDLETISNGYQSVPVLWLEPEIVTKENMEEVIVKNSFHSYSEIYE